MGLKFQELATLIIFVFLSVFQRKIKPSSIFLSASSVNKNIRCFRAGGNCEEIGFWIPFGLDCLKIVSRAAFWRQLPCSERGQRLVWESQARTGLRVQLPLIVLRSQQCQVLQEDKERSGVQWKGSMKLFLPIGASSSATDILAGQDQAWQAGRWKRTGSLPTGHLEVMAMVWCPCAQGRHAEGPESVLEVFMRYPTTPLVLPGLPGHQQPEGSMHGSSEKWDIALKISHPKGWRPWGKDDGVDLCSCTHSRYLLQVLNSTSDCGCACSAQRAGVY